MAEAWVAGYVTIHDESSVSLGNTVFTTDIHLGGKTDITSFESFFFTPKSC